jgi:hypothetical protein
VDGRFESDCGKFIYHLTIINYLQTHPHLDLAVDYGSQFVDYMRTNLVGLDRF